MRRVRHLRYGPLFILHVWNFLMNTIIRDRKEIGQHSAHGTHSTPLSRLRSRFGAAPTSSAAYSRPAPTVPSAPRDACPWNLTPEQHELWDERVCIMHYDGGLPWAEAARAALADVLSHSRAVQAGTSQRTLFPN